MRVALIASSRFPVAQPFAGGLEAHTWALARGLLARGHEVQLFAAPGSDPGLGVVELAVEPALLSDAARADVSWSAEWALQEHHAYLSLMLALADAPDVDVVHNNSLHYLPVAMAASLPVRMVSTLHTPPTPWLESAIQARAGCPVTFAAVSSHTARAWRHVVPAAAVVPNGIDLAQWRAGPGGEGAVWTGRLVPEKGPHLAAQAAARAGVPLRLAGPVVDTAYFDEQVRPWLSSSVQYVGHLTTAELVPFVGSADVALVTPCWEEPYGLVVAEALACGTPVAGFARGALPDLLTPEVGRLAGPGDVDGLARALVEAAVLDRAAVRAHAEAHCSVDVMVDGYLDLYDDLGEQAA